MLLSRRDCAVLHLWVLIAVLAAGDSGARELRPEDHGLEYQSSSASVGGKSPEMGSFFGGLSPSSSSTPDLPLPEAENASDPSWRWGPGFTGGGGKGSGDGRGRDRVRTVLVVASVVCGATGVALLLAAGLLFVFQMRRKRASVADK